MTSGWLGRLSNRESDFTACAGERIIETRTRGKVKLKRL